jgi:hypothetical protein
MKVDLDIGTGMRRRPLLRLLDGTTVAVQLHAPRRAVADAGPDMPLRSARTFLPLVKRCPRQVSNQAPPRPRQPHQDSTTSTMTDSPGK